MKVYPSKITDKYKSVLCSSAQKRFLFFANNPQTLDPSYRFLAHLYESTESYCCHLDVGVSIGVDMGITLGSFHVRVFVCEGQGTAGKLSCKWTGIVALWGLF